MKGLTDMDQIHRGMPQGEGYDTGAARRENGRFRSVALMLTLNGLAAYLEMPDWLRGLLIAVSILQLIPCIFVSLKIEQKAGYYQCRKCGGTWVPNYSQVFFAPHVGRSRKTTCPHCGRRCFHKRILTKDE